MAKKQVTKEQTVKLTPKEQVIQCIRAGYSYFWIYSLEPRRAEAVIKQVLNEYTTKDGKTFSGNVATWDCTEQTTMPEFIATFESATPFSATILRNFHMGLNHPDDRTEIIQRIINKADEYSSPQYRKVVFAICMSPDIPQELTRDFLKIEFPLPNDEELTQALDLICRSVGISMPKGELLDRAVRAARGLTFEEAKKAYTMSVLSCNKEIIPMVISKQRATIIKSVACLDICESDTTFDDLLGMEVMKTLVKKTASNPLARGIVVLGPTGTGKTAFGEAIGYETGKLVIIMSFEAIYQKYYGESEQMMLRAVEVIKTIGDCILFIDEMEKGTAGGTSANASGGRDVERRVMGTWLKFMQNRPSGIYVYATINNIIGFDPEYLRSERWDCVFYVPMPDEKQLIAMMTYYKGKFGVSGPNPDMSGWTGADVKTCCRMAAMLKCKVADAVQFVTPTSKIKGTEIKALEEHAKGKYIWADNRVIPNVLEKAVDYKVSIDV